MDTPREMERMNEEAIDMMQTGNFEGAVTLLDRALGSLMTKNEKDSSSLGCSCDSSVTTTSTYVGNDDSWSSLDEFMVPHNNNVVSIPFDDTTIEGERR